MTGIIASPDLVPSVWPCTAARNSDGALEIGGIDVRHLADQYATPLLVLDEEDLRRRWVGQHEVALGQREPDDGAGLETRDQVARQPAPPTYCPGRWS